MSCGQLRNGERPAAGPGDGGFRVGPREPITRQERRRQMEQRRSLRAFAAGLWLWTLILAAGTLWLMVEGARLLDRQAALSERVRVSVSGQRALR